jgi:Iron-containing redox enzyme
MSAGVESNRLVRHIEPRRVPLPEPRGPITQSLFTALRGAPGASLSTDHGPLAHNALDDDDLQLALYVCYELHYAKLEGVDERWEWAPSLMAFRAALEFKFQAALDAFVSPCSAEDCLDVGGSLQRLVANDSGPSLSRYVETQASHEELLELVIHRSAYQLKEADPHSWAIPRLTGAPKVALLEVQADEYGGGNVERMHSMLFAKTMDALGLDASYGHYIFQLPGITLATVNLMSYFGLHRRLRGALVGHLAAFEMTSSIPNRRYGNALRRLGYGPRATDFYDEHVEADAVHESIAAWDLAHGLARVEPTLAPDILIGARALLALEGRWARHLMDAWSEGRSSLSSSALASVR